MNGTSSGTQAARFEVAPLLREIGRGKDGSRALSREQAASLMRAILAGEVEDLALGGVLLALRMKGEAASEILGFLDALEPVLARAPAADRPWVIVPSYNGARSVANLAPLLALLLARDGVPVLMHGQESEPKAVPRARVTSAAIFSAMRIAPVATPEQALERARAGLPAFAALSVFAPSLARLIALRPILGVRNVAHTLAKLVRPVAGPSLLLASYTHPDFGRLQADVMRASGERALVMRATDGEAVVRAGRVQTIEFWNAGTSRVVLEGQSVAPPTEPLPDPGAEATAEWTRQVLDGAKPVPQAIKLQIDTVHSVIDS